jgi:hypothetical protein
VSKVEILAPVATPSGALGNLTLVDGRAIADTEEHAAEIAYAQATGYAVNPVKTTNARQAAARASEQPAATDPKGDDQQ